MMRCKCKSQQIKEDSSGRASRGLNGEGVEPSFVTTAAPRLILGVHVCIGRVCFVLLLNTSVNSCGNVQMVASSFVYETFRYMTT